MVEFFYSKNSRAVFLFVSRGTQDIFGYKNCSKMASLSKVIQDRGKCAVQIRANFCHKLILGNLRSSNTFVLFKQGLIKTYIHKEEIFSCVSNGVYNEILLHSYSESLSSKATRNAIKNLSYQHRSY